MFSYSWKRELIKRLAVASMTSFFTLPLGFAVFSYPIIRVLMFFKKEDVLSELFGLSSLKSTVG